MEAIILAGGFGKRLQNVVPNLPKPMAPIMGKPFLEILLNSLVSKGFTRIVLSVGYMSEKIMNYFGRSFLGIELFYVIENQPLGTGGAVRLALSSCRQDHVYIFNGDTFLDLEVAEIEKLWRKNHNLIIIGREVLDASRYGCLTSENGHLLKFSEKSIAGPGTINAGCYVFNRNQLDSFVPNTPFSIEREFLSNAALKIQIDVFVTTGLFIDIGIPDEYERAQNLLSF